MKNEAKWAHGRHMSEIYRRARECPRLGNPACTRGAWAHWHSGVGSTTAPEQKGRGREGRARGALSEALWPIASAQAAFSHP